jgi:UPF0755 protein
VKKGCSLLFLILFSMILLILGLFLIAEVVIPGQVQPLFGIPNPELNSFQKIRYSIELYFNKDELLTASDSTATDSIQFEIKKDQTVQSISQSLEDQKLIKNADHFNNLLVYAGLDTLIQSGKFKLSPSMSPVEIAVSLANSANGDITFSIIPGWRLEEIAESLPTSGLNITADDFLNIARDPNSNGINIPIRDVPSLEGLLLPGFYEIKREATANDLVNTILLTNQSLITPALENALAQQGLNPYEGIILASIVQRESIHSEEMKMIASVFLNRLRMGMKLDSDPTVQYSLGYNAEKNTWWKNPLSLNDLKINSLYNTYLHPGLPPTPIDNPSLDAINAVAFPEESDYLFFQAKCDGSGFHNFALTFDGHLQNSCP